MHFHLLLNYNYAKVPNNIQSVVWMLLVVTMGVTVGYNGVAIGYHGCSLVGMTQLTLMFC